LTICGSKLPARSRGTSISTGPTPGTAQGHAPGDPYWAMDAVVACRVGLRGAASDLVIDGIEPCRCYSF
jgi:hypothetical protein